MNDRIAEIRARLAAATPGPWKWGGHLRGPIQLEGAVPPRVYILSPPRSGSGYACWRVQPKETERNERGYGPMVSLRTYAVPERPYRDDIDYVDHPDAELIANAPADIEFLLGEVKRLRGALGDLVVDVEDDLPFPVPPDVGAALIGARDALGWEAIDVAGEGQG